MFAGFKIYDGGETNWSDGIMILVPKGRVTSTDEAEYLREMLKMHSHYHVIMDMSDVPYLNHAGAEAIRDTYINALANDRALKVCGLQEQPWRMLQAPSNWGAFFPYATVEDATESILGPSRKAPQKLLTAPPNNPA